MSVAVTGSVAFVSSAGGTGTSSSSIGARVYRTSDFTFTGTASFGIPIPFTHERWDTDGIHSGSSKQLFCNTAGYYYISGNVQFAPAGGGSRTLGLRVNNGVFIAEVLSTVVSIFVYEDMQVSCVYYLNIGDYVELNVNIGTLTTASIVALPNFTPEFMMHKF